MKLFIAACSVLMIAGCASVSAPQMVSDSTMPLKRNGFTLLPPDGKGWMIAPSGPYGAGFGKTIFNPDGSRATLTIQVWAGRFTDRNFDLRSDKGLREATEYTVSGGDPRRFKVIETKYSPVFQDQNTDCIKYEAVAEEHNNTLAWNQGQSLLMTFNGVVCRHPNSPDYIVTTLFSERRPQGQASLMDEQLRKEAEHSLSSIRFTPLK